MVVHAVSKTDRPIILENLLVDNAGLSDNAIAFAQHIQSPLGTTKVVACRLRGYRDYGIAFTAEGPESRSSFAELVDVIGCEFSGDQFWLSERVDPGSRIRVIDDSRSLLITPVGGSARAGRVRRRWNGQVSQIARFAEVVSPESISVRVVSSS